jgi:maleamate amidohydrolase
MLEMTTGVHSHENAELVEQYRQAGFGGRVGWGRKPGLLVIDMAGAWTAPDNQMGSNLAGVTDAVVRLLSIFREHDLPIYFTTMAYDESRREIGRAGLAKTPHLAQMIRGTEHVVLQPELRRRPEEILIEKPRPSAFWGTNFEAQLLSDDVDTLVVTGCSTSGCVRGTVEDAFNRNMHVIVPTEAVGDRSHTAHAASLFDIDMRYADVMPMQNVIDHLQEAK